MRAEQGRWLTDCGAAVPAADPVAAAQAGADLVGRWSEPHRRYHGLTHLHEVLAAVDHLARAGHLAPPDRTAAVLAAWFHDAVYSVTDAEDNERDSAALAARVLHDLGARPGLVERVVTLVLDTVEHDLDRAVEDPARLVLHDADLWVLAAPTARFDEYCRQVREEYAHVPVGRYAKARSDVLRPLLARERLYRTDFAHRNWEGDARENLARELTRLAA